MNDREKTTDEIGRMTLPQIACLASPKPPGGEKKLRSFAEYEAMLREEEVEWSVQP